ncbi:hypothetical protein BD779DRAFT_1478585 [Infundibulicybe gibba]|nr:hypothetical protein BD779DRAFT_1478585 [Infundibulicybe gibba]
MPPAAQGQIWVAAQLAAHGVGFSYFRHVQHLSHQSHLLNITPTQPIERGPTHAAGCRELFHGQATDLGRYIQAFAYQHAQYLVPLALARLRFHSIQGSSLKTEMWAYKSTNYVLAVFLDECIGTLDHNRVSYCGSYAVPIQYVDEISPCRDEIMSRTSARAPAVTLSFIGYDLQGKKSALVNATHSICNRWDVPLETDLFYEQELRRSILEVAD